MAWVQLTVQINGKEAEPVEDLLLALGASALTLVDDADQPLFEPPPGTTPIWEDTRIIGLFDAAADMDLIVAALKTNLDVTPFPQCRIEALEDKDWVRECMDSFKPMCFGKRLWVCPSWLTPPDPDAINMLLDPGLAFGTGTHQTTALCLKWLDAQDLEGKTLIDYGCGSGILAIAGALLGAKKVYCVDNDPQALLATQQNAERNNISEKIDVFSPETLPALEVDFLIANILAGPLMELAPKLAQLVKSGGNIALSGILAAQSGMVAASYQPTFTLLPPTQDEDWIRLNGTKQA